MARRTVPLLLASALTLALAACGGGDDGGLPIDRPADVETADPAVAPDPDRDTPDLEDLAEQFEDLDPEDLDLDEMMEGLDELISGVGGDGGGLVTVAGVTYAVESDSCIIGPGFFFIDGPAQGSDGSTAWVSVDYSLTTREEAQEWADERMLEMLFPDGAQFTEDLSVTVQVGATGRFDFPDDQPGWYASGGTGGFVQRPIDFELSGRTATGRGDAQDHNFIAADWDEWVPIEFEVGCN